MKRFPTACWAVALAVLLSGCIFGGGTKPDAATLPVTAAAAGPAPFSPQEMIATCATAIEKVATSAGGDAASKVVAVGAIERMCGPHAAGYMAQVWQAQQPRPEPSTGAALWQGFLQVADVGLRAWGIKIGGDIAINNSNNQANTAIASYGAFQAMGGQIRDAGIAGYPYVQAPQPNQILSGTGVLGSGSYVGPVTTTTTSTRTCTGGAAGAAVPPAIPGAGGAANC